MASRYAWGAWGVVTVCSMTYGFLALAAMASLSKVNTPLYSATAVMTASFLGFVVVTIYCTVSLLVLLRKYMDVQSGYIWLLGTSLHVSIFMALGSTLLRAADQDVELWLATARLTNSDYGVYRAARAFSFFMAALYLLIFVLLVIGRRFYYSHLDADHSSDISLPEPKGQTVQLNSLPDSADNTV